MEEPVQVVTVPLWFDLMAVFAGALFGAVHVRRRRKFDVAGMLFLAVCVGIGGSVVRDILLNLRPVALSKPEYLVTALGAGIVGLVLADRILRVRWLYELVDGTALGVYTMVGVTKALDVGFPYAGAIAVGGIAAVAGGLIRDILSNEVPETLRPGTPYLTAALLGAMVFALFEALSVPQGISVPIAIGLIIGLRFVSMGFGWQTPEPETVSAAIESAAQTTPTVVRKIPLLPLKAPKAVAPIGRHFHRSAPDEPVEGASPDSPDG